MDEARPPGPAWSSPQAEALFGSMELGAEQRILIQMGLREAGPGFASFAWLLGGQPGLLEHVFLGPMERWGASESFEPLRQHERALRMALGWSAMGGAGAPVAMWSPRPSAPVPARRRWPLWGLLAMNSPLSLLGSWTLCQGLYAAGLLPGWAFISLSGLSAAALSVAERRWLFPRWPKANPAAWAAWRWIAPQRGELEAIAARAQDCWSERCDPGRRAVGDRFTAADFKPGAYFGRREAGQEALPDMLMFETLLDQLRQGGLDPRVDAALAALSQQEIADLEKSLPLPATAGGPAATARRPARSL